MKATYRYTGKRRVVDPVAERTATLLSVALSLLFFSSAVLAVMVQS